MKIDVAKVSSFQNSIKAILETYTETVQVIRMINANHNI